jgi:Xaa-Pro aminopeptidase
VIPIESFVARRAKLAASMVDGVAIIPTAPERTRNRDAQYPYRFDSYFYYLTGFPEPDAVLVLIAGEQPKSVLFCRAKSEEREIWEGYRYGPEAAKATFTFDESFPVEALDEQLPKLIADQSKLYFMLGAEPLWDARVTGWINAVRAQARTGVRAPSDLVDLRALLDEMRLYKDAGEVATPARIAAPCSSYARACANTRSKPR